MDSPFAPAHLTIKAPKYVTSNPITGAKYDFSPNAGSQPSQSNFNSASGVAARQQSTYDTSIFQSSNKLTKGIGPPPPIVEQHPRLAKKVPRTIYKNTITGEATDFSIPRMQPTQSPNSGTKPINGTGSQLSQNGRRALNRSLDFEPRLSKTKPRTLIADPITGQFRKYSRERSPIEPLDTVLRQSKPRAAIGDFAHPAEAAARLGLQPNLPREERIAGGNKRASPVVPYVSPYQLNQPRSSSVMVESGPIERNYDKIGNVPAPDPTIGNEVPFYKGSQRSNDLRIHKSIFYPLFDPKMPAFPDTTNK